MLRCGIQWLIIWTCNIGWVGTRWNLGQTVCWLTWIIWWIFGWLMTISGSSGWLLVMGGLACGGLWAELLISGGLWDWLVTSWLLTSGWMWLMTSGGFSVWLVTRHTLAYWGLPMEEGVCWRFLVDLGFDLGHLLKLDSWQDVTRSWHLVE